MVLNASQAVIESCLRIPKDLVGKKIHPSTNVPHHVHLITRPSPYSRMPEDVSNQYLTMLEPFKEQSMSLIDGVERWEMKL